MDKDKVKGTVDDAVGRAKRQAGEWTGDLNKQMDGAAQQVKGKAEKAWGNVKDAARDANENARREDERDRNAGPSVVQREEVVRHEEVERHRKAS